MKAKRQALIREIVESQSIQTQEELAEALRTHGMMVTQATVSRDIRDLKLVKISTKDHRYKYALSPHDDIHISAKYRNIIRETIVNVDFANNFVVLRTYSGMAQAAAAAVDGMGWSEIVGTIAGDDTIFVMMRDNAAAVEFAERLKLIGRGSEK